MAQRQSVTRPTTHGIARNTATAEQILMQGNVQEKASNIYPLNLELAPGLTVTSVQIRLLTPEQIEQLRSAKGHVLGFMNIQIGGRVWINDFTMWHSTRNGRTSLLNPKQEGKDDRWYNKAYFLTEDLNRILEAAREAFKAARLAEETQAKSA